MELSFKKKTAELPAPRVSITCLNVFEATGSLYKYSNKKQMNVVLWPSPDAIFTLNPVKNCDSEHELWIYENKSRSSKTILANKQASFKKASKKCIIRVNLKILTFKKIDLGYNAFVFWLEPNPGQRMQYVYIFDHEADLKHLSLNLITIGQQESVKEFMKNKGSFNPFNADNSDEMMIWESEKVFALPQNYDRRSTAQFMEEELKLEDIEGYGKDVEAAELSQRKKLKHFDILYQKLKSNSFSASLKSSPPKKAPDTTADDELNPIETLKCFRGMSFGNSEELYEQPVPGEEPPKAEMGDVSADISDGEIEDLGDEHAIVMPLHSTPKMVTIGRLSNELL